MSFDLKRSLRRFKPERRKAELRRRPQEQLSFVPRSPSAGLELLLDTCVYIDVLQHRAPDNLKLLLGARISNHSAVALGELAHLFGRLNPRDGRTKNVLATIADVISAMPEHRVTVPSLNAVVEAGILAGLAARLSSIELGREQALLNDAMLYLQAVENGQMLLTRNIREFDWFDQLFPCNRVLFYSRI